jgi:ribosomal protein L11 methylase PrmA
LITNTENDPKTKGYFDPGSFRNPSGRVLHRDGSVYRLVSHSGWGNFEKVLASGLIEELSADGSVLPLAEVDCSVVGNPEGIVRVFETQKLPFLSWPFEWPFSVLKAAALLHLDLQLRALDRNITLSDASAYNIQFQGAKPVFIDHLSFRPYVEGEIWGGHRQFCKQFLNPLILASTVGVMPNDWYRGSQEGLSTVDLAPLIPFRNKFCWPMFMHVFMQDRLDRAIVADGESVDTRAISKAKLPKVAQVNMIRSLKNWITGMKPLGGATVWRDYADDNSYLAAEAIEKKRLVAEMAAEIKPNLMLDLGCNSGEYSATALAAGAQQVIGFDIDFGALEAAFARARENDLNFVPLYFDAANPSPDQGWAQRERAGFSRRAQGDALLALAFVHHLAIGRNIPLGALTNWLIDRAEHGIIEFVPKEDPMVQRLLALREDIFPDYSFETFITAVRARAAVISDIQISRSGRRLVRYTRIVEPN